MKVVYFGYHATFGASLMAAIHIGIYTVNKLPPYDWIIAHYKTCLLHRIQYGNLIYIGIDEQMREIYFIGCRRRSMVIQLAMASASKIIGLDDLIHFVDTRKADGVIPHIITLFMRYNCLQPFCAALFYFWFRKKYVRCAKMVEDQKELMNVVVV